MKSLIERCPFRTGTASRDIFLALAHSKKAMSAAEVSKRAKVGGAKTGTLLAAFQNVFHNASLRKAGISLLRDGKGGYFLRGCEADPEAKRPAKGKAERKAGRKTDRRARRQPSRSKRPKPSKRVKTLESPKTSKLRNSTKRQEPETPTSGEAATLPTPNADANQAAEGSQP